MKNQFASLFLSFLILTSCTTRIVSATKPYADEKVKVGEKYTFVSKNHEKSIFTVTKMDANNIYGENTYTKKQFSVEKANIETIKKASGGKTALLIAGSALLIYVGYNFYLNKPLF